ncbi:MAG: hypothetical protein ABJM29_13605 [Rhizobiaceae bacterium]
MKQIVLSAALFLGLLVAPQMARADGAKSAQTKWPECYCTDRYGKRHELGDIICLTVDNRSYEAKCVMAQNNPFWRDLNRGCLSSSLPPNMSPRSNEVAVLYQ